MKFSWERGQKSEGTIPSNSWEEACGSGVLSISQAAVKEAQEACPGLAILAHCGLLSCVLDMNEEHGFPQVFRDRLIVFHGRSGMWVFILSSEQLCEISLVK